MHNRFKTHFACLSAILIGIAFPASADPLEKVRFGTNWVAEGEHGGFYQAAADGTYAACGLDVEIVPGGPQINNRALLIAGRIDFHLGANMQEAFSARLQEIPLTVVAALFQKEPLVLMAHPGQGFDTLEDLREADLLIGDAGYHSYYRWLIAEYGFRPERRKPYTFNSAPFIANPRAVQQGYATAEPFAIEKAAGFRPEVFLLADYGYKGYSTTIEAMAPYIARNPDKVRCFVNGSIIGWTNYLYGDPAKGNALIKRQNPDMSEEQLAYSIARMREYGIVYSGDAETLGIGAMTRERHQAFHSQLVGAGIFEKGFDIEKSFTLDFVNKGVGLDLKKKLAAQ